MSSNRAPTSATSVPQSWETPKYAVRSYVRKRTPRMSNHPAMFRPRITIFIVLRNYFVPCLVRRKFCCNANGFTVVPCVEHVFHCSFERSVVHRVKLHVVGQLRGKTVIEADERRFAKCQ